ncbi:MAG: hypothetical protein ACTSU6_06580 [Candidatus Njordarchaeales archaeon]
MIWISENWTSKMYNIPLWPLDLFIAQKIFEVFAPVAFIILIDIAVFIFFIYHFWKKARKTPIKRALDAIVQVFIILPMSSWLWAIFHLSIPLLGDNRLGMHLCFFSVWLMLSGIAAILYYLKFSS